MKGTDVHSQKLTNIIKILKEREWLPKKSAADSKNHLNLTDFSKVLTNILAFLLSILKILVSFGLYTLVPLI